MTTFRRAASTVFRVCSSTALLALAASTAFDATADDAMRCRNGRLVDIGMAAEEVTARCGEPQGRSSEDIPVRARLPNGNVIVTGTTRVDRWTYHRGLGQFDAVLSFEDGKLVRIDLLTSR